MEQDFKDAMSLLASRLGEKKPLEDAIHYVEKFMPESRVATELLDSVLRNIMVLGLTLRSAIFDPVYGAMRNIPSRLMEGAFRIMVDSIELGPEVASISLISVSNQIRDIQKINDLIRKMLGDITGMMKTMATFIAPVVLGIVASLQTIIVNILEPLTESDAMGGAAATGAGSEFGGALGGSASEGVIGASAVEAMADPHIFQMIVGLYVIELVIIMTYFAAKVDYGDNRTAIMLTVGKALPIAIAVFVGALFLGGMMMGGLVA
jgi:hypothetical protein